ncbi:ABC transporter ATP-binding protein [Nocardia donostiensis]|uniref:ABC transporter ATP-binding protein n=1 Tax=Nocardia donostiensis TaxID=1538463 RepID=UPI0009D9BB17|nr:ABC transporter ATP-binding protein [Nocardia donostiensis]OQS13483.1 ABC transporter ATP-binding protein [Nocardia donostiensis]
MAEPISVSGLVKHFGRTVAVDGLDLTVEAGEVHGFLGPNGAGKSTTIRILLGLLEADAGSVQLLGGDPWRDATTLHERLAYVPGDVVLWPGLSGGEIIDLLLQVHGRADRAKRDEMIERFDLDPRTRARAYSKGNRQKVALIAAFASDAELLILDEPTSGLDPLMEAVFRDVVREQCRDGRTVLLSSHVLSEVDALCDRVTIIRDGRTVDTGRLAELRRLNTTAVQAQISGPPDGFAELPGVHSVRYEADALSFDVDNDALGTVLRHLDLLGVRSLTSRPPTLEELFLRYYDRKATTTAEVGR